MLADVWIETSNEYFVCRHGEIEAVIRSDLDGWVLECDHFDYRWIDDSPAALEAQAQNIHALMLEIADFRTRPTTEKIELLNGGVTLRASTKEDGFHVTLVGADGVEVGYYAGYINPPQTRFVLQQNTISGSVWLAEEYRGRGYADLMRDAAEAITGIAPVPHGVNMAPGSLSEAARKSWDRRARTKPYPGFAPNMFTSIRTKRTIENNCYWMDRFCLDTPDRHITLAASTGSDIVFGFNQNSSGHDTLPLFAYVVAQDETALSVYGVTDQAMLVHMLESRHGFTARLERYSGEEALDRFSDTHFSFIGIPSSATFPAPSDTQFFQRLRTRLTCKETNSLARATCVAQRTIMPRR